MSKREIFDALKNKNLLVKKEVELKPGNLLYFVLWFSDKPVMYSFTTYYKGMLFSGCDEKTIKKYDSDFIWNETDHSPKTTYVTNNGRDQDPNVCFFGRYPSFMDDKINDYIKHRNSKRHLFHLNECTNSGFIFNYMKEGCSLEVKFTHTLFDRYYVGKNKGDQLEVICKTKNWFKYNHFLEDEDGNFLLWALTKRFPKQASDLFGYIGYLCMVEEIVEQYGKFVHEKDLSGRNYKVEYKYRFIPKDLEECIKNIEGSPEVVQCVYTDDFESMLANDDIEDYIYCWK